MKSTNLTKFSFFFVEGERKVDIAKSILGASHSVIEGDSVYNNQIEFSVDENLITREGDNFSFVKGGYRFFGVDSFNWQERYFNYEIENTNMKES